MQRPFAAASPTTAESPVFARDVYAGLSSLTLVSSFCVLVIIYFALRLGGERGVNVLCRGAYDVWDIMLRVAVKKYYNSFRRNTTKTVEKRCDKKG